MLGPRFSLHTHSVRRRLTKRRMVPRYAWHQNVQVRCSTRQYAFGRLRTRRPTTSQPPAAAGLAVTRCPRTAAHGSASSSSRWSPSRSTRLGVVVASMCGVAADADAPRPAAAPPALGAPLPATRVGSPAARGRPWPPPTRMVGYRARMLRTRRWRRPFAVPPPTHPEAPYGLCYSGHTSQGSRLPLTPFLS